MPLVSLCHAVLAVKAFAREDARSRSAAEDRGGLDGCAAACRFLTQAIPPPGHEAAPDGVDITVRRLATVTI